MMTAKRQKKLDDFKKSYILKKADEMAQDYQFIKGFTLNRMAEYTHLLFKFLKENDQKIDNLLKEIKSGQKIDKNNFMLKELNFIIQIPKLIKIYNNETDIDYIFLQSNFLKLKTEENMIELKDSLKELEQEFSSSNLFNISNLYKFGNFILSFLDDFDFRRKICIDLLSSESKLKNNISETISEQVIQNQKNINTWNSTQSIRA